MRGDNMDHLFEEWSLIKYCFLFWNKCKSNSWWINSKLNWMNTKMSMMHMSVLLSGCTSWMLIKLMERKLLGNYTRMLQTVLKEILKAILYKRVALWPLTSHLTNHPSKMKHAWKVKANSSVMFFYGLLHMNSPGLADQQGLVYISSVWTLGEVLRTYQEQLMRCW